MSKERLKKLMSEMAELAEAPPEYECSREQLERAFAKLNTKHSFKPGDIVQWKSGLKNKRSSGPMIVIEVLECPICDPAQETGSQYFREPLDIILGKCDSEGEFICYHYDSRRFEPYTQD